MYKVNVNLGEKVSTIKIFNFFQFLHDHLNSDDALASTTCQFEFAFFERTIVIKVCFKTFVTHIIKLYKFPNTSGKSIFQIALESLQGRTTST